MNMREYARAQQRPVRPLQKLVRAVLHALGVPVTPVQVHDVAIRLYRPTLDARDYNYRAAVAYLQPQLPSGVIVPAPRDYPIQALEQTITRVSSGLRIAGEPVNPDTRSDTLVIEEARKAIEGPITRHALEPARETAQAIGEDELLDGYGWARVLVGAYSCSFCAMLASRGPVYTSRAAATGRGGSPLDLFHTPYLNKNGKRVGGNCDCIAALVPRHKSWEGERAYLALEDLWQRTTEGFSNDDARNAFRRNWDAKVRAGETERYLASSLQPKRAA